MTILHIDSSILGENSVSRAVSAAIVARLRRDDPSARVVRRDLVADPLPHLSGAHLAAASGADVDPETVKEAAAGDAALAEFMAAQTVVIGAPMYNFTLSTQLKAWLDRILIAGRTFRYTATGPVGLAGGKRVIVALARGGFYGPENAAAEHLESYLRFVFGFIGITDVEFIAADGIAIGPEQRAASLAGALAAVETRRAA